tara:strand:+ start:219 stop:1514 length:1296 start_codon:yes stop_codon:yes gene_type:complete
MAEYNRPQSEAEFNENFKDKTPLMNDTQAHYESSRCLFCYDAPCMNACPTAIDIPLFIKKINTGNIDGAAQTIYDSNWIGNACGTVCPTGVLCEGACVYNKQSVPAVQIGKLQNFATRHVIDNNKKLFEAGKDNGKKIAIIGGGPAGISCACELRKMGYTADIFEAKDKPSGLTVYGIAPYKITNEEVLDEVKYLQEQLGFNIKYNSPISSKDQLEQIEKDYDAVFIGVGLGPTAFRNIPGEDKSGIIGAVEFVEDLRMNHHKTNVGKEVIILGGGNTAMDAASESARMGATKVILAYRGSKEKMGAYDFEYELAISSGIKSVFDANPKEFLGEDSVEGVKFSRADGSEFTINCDMVIKATGQAKMGSFFKLIDNMETDESSRIKVNKKNNQTSNPKYFAGGDAINGGAEVVNAAYDGKLAALGIHKWLNE